MSQSPIIHPCTIPITLETVLHHLAQEEINDKFPTPFHFASFVLEAKKGDVMSRVVLLELKLNRARLIALDVEGELSVTKEGKPSPKWRGLLVHIARRWRMFRLANKAIAHWRHTQGCQDDFRYYLL